MQEIVEPFLVDGAADAEHLHGVRRIAAVTHARWRRRHAETPRVEAVIDEIDGCRGTADLAQMCGVGRRACGRPGARIELLAYFPVRGCPDVLGMRRAAPGQATQDRGITRHR